jgi:hypothetical protein
MKLFISLLFMMFTMNSYAVWDMLVNAKPDRDYMNFFYKGYIPWFEKTFNKELTLPGADGKKFFSLAIEKIDHWKVPGHLKHDQLLIGQNEKKEISLFIYLHPEIREHDYIKKFRLNFSPEFISTNGQELCFATFNKTPGWRHLPRDGKEYLSHFCQVKNQFIMKYVSFISKRETKAFKNPFEGLVEWEIAMFDKTKQVSSFYSIKNLHMAFIPKEFYMYIMEHGAKTHMPLDKLSIDMNGQMQVYYP